jgi:hypothetical protein
MVLQQQQSKSCDKKIVNSGGTCGSYKNYDFSKSLVGINSHKMGTHFPNSSSKA